MKKLDEEFIIELSKKKNEPEWMREFRLKSFKKFQELDNPNFGPKIDLDLDKILYYKDINQTNVDDWNKVKENIRDTFCNLGVIKAENEYLGGVTNQYESEVVYHKNKE